MEYLIIWNVAMIIGFAVGYKIRPMTKDYKITKEQELKYKKKNDDVNAIMEYNEAIAIGGPINE